ncbi:hypothetical protein AAVH_38725 [Aphelenchoides avenae]|nr:hypothetical protein AAVH_38725 [Aphelenchus avenae]
MYLSTDSTRTIRDIAYWAPVGSTPERWYYVNAQKLFHKAVAIRERGIRLEAVGPKYGYIDNMADIIFDLVEILAYDSNPMHEPLKFAVHNLVPVVKVKCCPTKPLKYHGRDIEEDKKLAAFASLRQLHFLVDMFSTMEPYMPPYQLTMDAVVLREFIVYTWQRGNITEFFIAQQAALGLQEGCVPEAQPESFLKHTTPYARQRH